MLRPTRSFAVFVKRATFATLSLALLLTVPTFAKSWRTAFEALTSATDPSVSALTASGALFESNWDTATGTSKSAVTDGGRWPNYWEFNNGTNVQLLTVVSGGPGGHNALRVEQRGPQYAANLQLNDFVGTSRDYYVRYYMKNDDTSSAGDHVVTVDTWEYDNLTFMRKMSSSTGWRPIMSMYGCGFTYPIGHWFLSSKLQRGAWYRFEYFVDFIDSTHVRVYPRIYDANGTLIMNEANYRQEDYGSSSWKGRKDWTLKSFYAAGHSFCVTPKFMNDFALGNNGQAGASNTRLAWYFSGVELRTDRWPGPVAQKGATSSPTQTPTEPAAPSSGSGSGSSSGSGSGSGSGSSSSGSSLSAKYPKDVNIESDPNVVFVEKFESSVSSITGRWTDVLNGSRMSTSSDVPPGGSGSRSLSIPVSPGGHLYKQLSNYDGTLYIRYYIKYPTAGTYRHDGVWMGGYNPSLSWPNPQAGIKPTGSDRFAASAEQSDDGRRFDHYNYWADMRRANDGMYWGNTLLNKSSVNVPANTWTCVEQMVKLNTVGDSNGEHAIWLNGVKVSHLGKGFPNGRWSGGNFIQDSSGSPFPGFRWRTTSSLKLNYIWLQNFGGSGSGTMKFDHLVVAKTYIGCLS